MNKIIVLFVLCGSFSVAFGAAYKCSENGKIVYADQPCGSDSKPIDTVSDPSANNNSDPSGHYYSVENQLQRIEQEKAEIELKRREKNLADEQIRLNKKQIETGKNIDQAECEYYRARVREEENNLREGRQSREHRLGDESYLNLLHKSAAEYCR